MLVNRTVRGVSHLTRRNSVRRNISQTLFAAILAASASCHAGNFYNFTGATAANWNIAGNWTLNAGSAHAVPGVGDSAQLGVTGTTALSVNFNMSYSAATALASLTINAQVPSTCTLNQTTAGTTMYAGEEYIGTSIYGNIYNQSAGTNDVTDSLTMASTSTSYSNSYNLSGTGVLNVTNYEYIGSSGAGTFTQSGGTNTASEVYLGYNSTGTGVYNFSAGSLNAGTIFDGFDSTGTNTFTQSGTAAVTITSGSGGLTVGAVGTATYNLNGGTIVLNNSAELIAGYIGTGTMNQTAGSVTFNSGAGSGGWLWVGISGTGQYTLSGTGTIGGAVKELIGGGFTGTFTQSAGTNALDINSGVLAIGNNSTGTYNLNGGTLSSPTINIGVGTNSGTLNQAAGSILDCTGEMTIGTQGVYAMTGGTVTLTSNATTIDMLGGGSATQSGGTINATNGLIYVGDSGSAAANYTLSGTGQINTSSLVVGNNSGTTAAFTLSSGTINASNEEIIAEIGNGTFTQTGGTNTTSDLTVGQEGGAGVYNLSAGTLTVNGTEYISQALNGTFNQSGGMHTVTGGLDLGLNESSASNGIYNLSGGTLSVTGGNETVGDDGYGTFSQTNGVNSITNNLYVGLDSGDVPGDYGYYTLSGGTLNDGTGEYIGVFDDGTFVQSGGINNANGGLIISGFGFTSAYYIAAGTLNVANINVHAAGTINIGGGLINCASGTLSIDTGGQVNFSGGELELNNLNTNGAPASFNWTGGELLITTDLTLDSGAATVTTGGAFGASLVVKSGATLAVNGSEWIGGTNFFTLTLNAGSADTATGYLTINPAGTLIQNGGTILQDVTNYGVFSYFGGTFTGNLNNQGTAYFELAGTISNGVSNVGTITFGLGATVTLGGSGFTNAGSATLAGGTVTGSLNNFGMLSGYGSIAGTIINNSGAITESGGNLFLGTSGAAINNTGTVTGAPGLRLEVGGDGNITNDGTWNINGGTLSIDTQFSNNSDGVVTGPGKITGSYLNFGTLEVPDGNTAVPSFTNYGIIEMAGASAVLGSGSAIVNDSTIEGFGKISETITNNQTIQPTGGTLTFSNPLTNSTTGTITVPAGGKILMLGPVFPANAGLISLTGGTFDNGGNPLNNTGSIIGYGTFATGNTGLVNNGSITFAGGTTTVNGNVTNNTGKTINIKYQPAIFTGNLTNNVGAIINTFSTSFTVGGTFTNNGAYNSDPSSNIFQSNVVSGGSMTGNVGDEFVFSGGTFNNTGTFTNGGLLQSSDPITNSGTFTQSGLQNWTAGTTFTNTAGTATFNTDSGPALPPVPSPLTMVATGGVIKLNVTQHLAALSISGSGKVDMSNTQLFVATTPAATIRSYLTSSYDHGNWDLPGLTSSIIATHAGTSLGYNAGSSGVEIKYTWIGDANLDGVVNAADLTAISSTGATWATGDFNYDDVVNADDYALFMLGAVYGSSTNISTTLPEPGEVMLISAFLAGMICRRKSGRN